MSWFEDSNIKKSYIVQTVSDVGIFSACTQIYLTNISPCAGDTINITGNLGVSGNISGTTYFGDGSQLSGIVTTDNFVTGGVYSASSETLYFTGTTGFTPFSVDVSALLDNTNNFVTGGTYNSSTDIVTLTRNDNVNINITGVSNTFTTGATYNEGTELITFVKNDGNTYTADLAAIASATTNSFTTGATLNGNIIEFANSVLGLDYYNVDLTSIVSGTTNGYTTGATLNGNIIEFANNLLGLDYYNVDLTSLVSGKLDTTTFNTYTGDTNTALDGKLPTTTFNSYTGSVVDVHVSSGNANAGTQQLSFSNTSGGTFNVTNSAALFSDNDINVTGGTYDTNTGCVTFTTNSATTFDVCGFVTGITDTFVTGGTLTGENLVLERNSGVDVGNIDLSGLVSGKLEISLFNTYTGDTETSLGTKTDNTNFVSHTGDTTIHYTKGSINLSELGSSAHTHSISEVVNLQTNLDAKLATTLFNTYTGDTETALGNKLATTTFNSYTGSVVDVHVSSGSANAGTQQLTFTNTSGGTFNVTNAAALFSDNDVNVTGGTYNASTGCVTFTTNSATTFDVCGFVTGLTDTFVSGGTLSGNNLVLERNSGVDVGNIDLSGLLNNSALVGSYLDERVARWNSTTNTLQNGLIRDDGSTVSIGGGPSASNTFFVDNTSLTVSILGQTQDGNNNQTHSVRALNKNGSAGNNAYATGIFAESRPTGTPTNGIYTAGRFLQGNFTELSSASQLELTALQIQVDTNTGSDELHGINVDKFDINDAVSGNAYAIRIAGFTGSGVVSGTKYGIYQVGTEKNYFGGQLQLNTVGAATPVTNLGVDVSGNIVSGTTGGDVSKVGTPANNQIGVWTGDGTIEGDSNLTWDGSEINVTDADGNLTEVRADWLRVFNETDDANLFLYGYGTGHRGEIVLGAANGDITTPTATLNGNTVATISAYGHSGTGFRQGGQAIFLATENYTEGSAYGTRFVIQTVADGSTTLVTRYATDGNGDHNFTGNVSITGGQLKLNSVGSGTSVTNLGVDASGNVVSGTTGGGGTSYWEETASTIKLDTGETTRDVVEIATGGANTLSGTYSIGNLLIGDGNTFGNGQTVRRSFIGGNGVVVGVSEAFQTSIAFGQSLTVEGTSTSVFGASHIVKGNYNFTAGQNNDLYGDNLTSIGNNNILGTSSVNINRSVVIGEDADSYADDQIVIGFGLSTNASWGAAKAIYIGIEEGRSSSGWFSDPTIGSGTNFALGGNNTMRTDVGVIKAGAGRGILYLNNYTGSSVSEPTVDISDSVGLWAKNRDTGVTGLIVKAENGGMSWIGDRVGVNTIAPTEALDVSGNTVMSGTLNIGTVNAGTAVKNLAVDTNDNVVASSAPITTTYRINSNADVDLFNDTKIQIRWDQSQDDIDMTILVDPTTSQVHVTKTKDGSDTTFDLENSDGATQIEGAMGTDDKIDIVAYAPSDNAYPHYRIKIVRSNSLNYTNSPFLVIVEKWTSYD